MKPFTVIDAPQRSPEWFAARAGRLTGSVAKHLLSKGKGSEEPVGKRDLRWQLVTEQLTGRTGEDMDRFVNAAMQWGIDHEDQAFAAYEALTGQMAVRTGFLSHTDLMIGCSLDGHVGDFDGILECKCPKSTTHWGYVRGEVVVPADHLAQVTHNLFVTGAAWCDFLSFDPRFPPHLQTFLVRVERTNVDLARYEVLVRAFLDEVDRELAAVKGWKVFKEIA